jgi:hypothetical protein
LPAAYKGWQLVGHPLGGENSTFTASNFRSKVLTIPVWQVITWAPVRATLPEWQAALARMRPMGASAPDGALAPGQRHGQLLWGTECGGQPLGLAWDWAEVRADVPALSDPMGVLSNVQLLDEEGDCLNEGLRILHLNSAVHGLGWQRNACGQAAQSLERLAA